PPKPPQPRPIGGSSTIGSESPETVTLYDIKSEINPDADEIERESDGGSEEYDDYATYDDDGVHGAPSGGVGPTESSRLETAAMSPIRPSLQTQFDQLLGRADDMGLPIGEERREGEASDGELRERGQRGHLSIHSVIGGGRVPVVNLGALSFGGDDFFSARGGETCVRQDPNNRGGQLAPSHSATDLLSELQQNLGDKEARLPQLEKS